MSKHILNFSQWMELKENRNIQGNILNENESKDISIISLSKSRDLTKNVINSKNYSDEFLETLCKKLYSEIASRYNDTSSYGSKLNDVINVIMGQKEDVLHYTNFYLKVQDSTQLISHDSTYSFKKIQFKDSDESSEDIIIKTIYPNVTYGSYYFVMNMKNLSKGTGTALSIKDYNSNKPLNLKEIKFSNKGELLDLNSFTSAYKLNQNLSNIIHNIKQVDTSVEKFKSLVKSGQLESNIPLAFADQFNIIDFEKEPVEKQLATLFGVKLKNEHLQDGIATLFKKDTTIKEFAKGKEKI